MDRTRGYLVTLVLDFKIITALDAHLPAVEVEEGDVEPDAGACGSTEKSHLYVCSLSAPYPQLYSPLP